MSYPGGIHPWTIDWFETLPQSYQSLDAVQKNPVPPLWDGLNASPFDQTETGGWTTQNDSPEQKTIMQAFRSAAGQRVYYQAWLEPGAQSGGNAAIYVWDTTTSTLIVTNDENQALNVTGPTSITGWFYPPASGNFAIMIVTENKLVLEEPVESARPIVDAVNISRRSVEYTELPRTLTGNSETFHPLLRYMNGIGQIGGEYRQISDNMWDGQYTDPATCPDGSLRWLAQMAGIHRNVYRLLPADDLRALIAATKERGLTALGSRSAIADIVKPYLWGEKFCLVGPHPAKPHTILIRVKFTEVPNNDLSALAANIRKTRVIPAGHVIEIIEALATWDAWEAAAGATWDELEGKVTRWGEQDTLGVSLD